MASVPLPVVVALDAVAHIDAGPAEAALRVRERFEGCSIIGRHRHPPEATRLWTGSTVIGRVGDGHDTDPLAKGKHPC